jgi:hypothetical protein
MKSDLVPTHGQSTLISALLDSKERSFFAMLEIRIIERGDAGGRALLDKNATHTGAIRDFFMATR